MGYISYEEYISYGGSLDSTAFANYQFEVESKMNYLTNNRIKLLEEIPECVGRLEVKLIGLFYELNNGSNKSGLAQTQNLVSYSNGIESFGYGGVSGSSSKSGSTSIDNTIYAIMSEYLSEYPELLYRGRRQWKH